MVYLRQSAKFNQLYEDIHSNNKPYIDWQYIVYRLERKFIPLLSQDGGIEEINNMLQKASMVL